jgi:Flp pilus assembly CpaF family ATPase
MTEPRRKPKMPKTTRQRSQRQVQADRLQRQALRERIDRPDVLPVRDDDEGRYRP